LDTASTSGPDRRWTGLALWLCVAGAATVALWLFRGRLGTAHVALAYLLVVLLGSARRGRLVGLVLSVVCFLAFNFFLIPPYYTLALHDALDLWVLVSFLVTGAVAAELLHRAQRAAEVAESRARELDRLAAERERLASEAQHVTALLEADRMKDAVLASVSHDLRTPLTSIQALAAELRAGGDERAVIIEEEAIRLNRMVTDLLDLSRIRTGSLTVEAQLIAAEDVIGAALQRIGGAHGADRIDVSLPPDGSLPVGRIDFTHTLRVVVNLLENALRHSPPGRRVELEVSEEGEALVIRVLDRGPGVPDGERARIFEPFQLGAGGTGGRAGLGLAIARSLTAAQGGTVTHLHRPGGGSVFELRLPRGHVEALEGAS
jgi:K+-sensing histidine kinase KdpD